MDITTLVEGRYLNPHVVCCVISLDTINYNHYINKWQQQGLVINVCQNQKPRSAVIFLSNLVLITSVSAETIRDRLSASGEI
jgi:regulator of extracellular matrix RemA (YlzA/DUF370 family)